MNRRDFLAASAAAGVVGLFGIPGAARAAKGDALLGFVGDLLADCDRPVEAFEPVVGMLEVPDLLFGNLEGAYSDNPQTVPSAPIQLVPKAYNLDVFKQIGFDVMSLANNHIVDGGHAAMLETMQRLREQGVATCGAGRDLDAARAPAIVETNGLKIAYLAYASVFPMGYQARPGVPGLAPMRAYNHFHEGVDDYYLPGTQPRIETIPNQTDLANLKADIAGAREQADLVIASFHWGDYLRPYYLTDHEIRTAHLCIDEGVDIVVGHHHHVLRGMEWYKGKPIYYDLGHFVFDIRLDRSPELLAAMPLLDDSSAYYGVAPRKDWPLMPLHPEARMTALAWANVEGGEVTEIGFVPCRLNPAGQVRPVDPESAEGREVVAYVATGCSSQNINGQIDTGGYTDIAGHRGVRIVPAAE